MAERSLEWTLGTVAQTNDKGVKLEGESEWHNWSQYAEGEKVTPAKGTKVRLGLDNKGFIRQITDPDKNPLSSASAHGSSGGNGHGFTPADQRRMTLLSCLSSACTLLAGVGVPLDETTGKPVKPATQLAM